MNTAFHDASNLAWKIHHVEAGFANRAVLSSYETERKLIAQNLLDFDAQYAKLFSERKPSTGEVKAASDTHNQEEKENLFIATFKANCEFTSGYGAIYNTNLYNWSTDHPAQSLLFNPKGTTLRPGRIMPPATVTRVVDANVVHLEQEVPLNGSFRIFIFAGVPSVTKQAVFDFASNIEKKKSFISTFARDDIATVSYHERHNPHSHFFTICTTFAAPRARIEIADDLPSILARYSSHIYADDIPDVRVPNAKAAAHAKMGLDEERGAVVVVRPDSYIACVIRLVEGSGTVDALNKYFAAFVSKPIGNTDVQAQL